MAYTCSQCTYLKVGGDWPDIYGRYYCTRKGEKVTANSQECWNFCKDYSRSSSTAKSYEDYSKSHQSSGGCYLTTITCEILKFYDSNPYLNSLRRFRDDVLQKNPNTIEILKEYDFIGPLIADKLRNDPDKVSIAQSLLINYIAPTCFYVERHEYNKAINTYSKMTKLLISKYNLNMLELSVPEDKSFDYQKNYSLLGHGKRNYA